MPEPRRGRPRSEAKRRAVLDAAAALLPEEGYEGLTIEAVAERAGVGRQTVYRWWPSKGAIIAECVLDGTVGGHGREIADSGDLRADLHDWARRYAESMARPDGAPLVRALAAAAADRSSDAERLYARFTGPFHAAMAARFTAAGHPLPEAAADALIGAALYRVIAGVSVDPPRLIAVADALLAAAGPPGGR